jgi:hypothetical protein
MTRWKWLNRQKFDEDQRRPISGRRCPAKSGLLAKAGIISEANSIQSNEECDHLLQLASVIHLFLGHIQESSPIKKSIGCNDILACYIGNPDGQM